ncbi:MAG: 3-dehydroquinate synthase [Spirochaetes bacterium]|nr:3-dehydroquinate synthase [Spirochaetota bacterium]
MPVDTLRIRSRIRDYTVYFYETTGFLSGLASMPNTVFVVDENVWKLHGSECLARLTDRERLILPIAEERKSLVSVEELYDRIMVKSPKKNLILVSIGGGITQDITGYVASTLYRGIKWIYIPTTLLAQADSCIGAKTSLNYKNYKNLIGTFYPPHEVYIVPHFLDSLGDLDYFSGIGEIAKLHIIGGEGRVKSFIEDLKGLRDRDALALNRAIHAALSIKEGYIEDDEFDSGRRNILNYGHCFGHAIESSTDFAVPHGQAVVLGMILANYVARNRGVLAAETENRILHEVLLPVLYVDPNRVSIDEDRIVESMKKDKKRIGEGLPLVMPESINSMIKVNDLAESEAREALGMIKSMRSLGNTNS